MVCIMPSVSPITPRLCEAWTKDPSIFKVNPRHLIPGPHIYG
jgi:hypothetical protein